MIVIRTWDALARALDSPLDPELKQLLQAHWDRLQEWQDYALEELAQFIIVQPGDSLDDVMGACGWSPATDFASPVEIITQHSQLIEAVFILSDDGFGLVLLVPIAQTTDPAVLAACNKLLQP
jgi:hypothetical protein